jgi:cation:H+ antiporter
MAVLLIVVGLFLLVFGGDYLVKGAAGIALKYDMPAMLVGMTIVAIGTSAPELVVSVQAALAGKPDIAIGNVVGSNIANVALILGLTVLIFPIAVRKTSLQFDWVAMMLASVAFYVLALDSLISRIEGVFMVLGLIAFISLSFHKARKSKVQRIADDVPLDAKTKATWLLFLFVVLGSVALIFGARWFLQGAEVVAKNFGMSDRVIAVTLVAFGTSVPELATSVIAAIKKQDDISLGNIIGSNLFNLLSIIGIAAAIMPIGVSDEIMSSDVFWMIGTSFAILPLSIIGYRINRFSGALLVLTYIVFVYFMLSTP